MTKIDLENLVLDDTQKSGETGFHIIDLLSYSRFPVFLVASEDTEETMVLKLFPSVTKGSSTSFNNEARLTQLTHPNLLRTIELQRDTYVPESQVESKVSYKLMEYCPHGDFFSLVEGTSFASDEKLARTYFHQLVSGVEYLHNNGVAHLDLKLENLLLAEDFTLKITDFEMSYVKGDIRIQSRGTPQYRAPEVRENCCHDPMAADIYSMGIVLFLMMTKYFPQMENLRVCNLDLYSLLHGDDPVSYWKGMKLIYFTNKRRFNLSKEFQDLFWSMTRKDLKLRATLKSIKEKPWFNGPIYNKEELKRVMCNKLLEKTN